MTGPIRPHIASCRIADEDGTARCASRLAGLARRGDVFCLIGDLGAGKTSFARAFIRALTEPGQLVPSPTFTLVQPYETAADSEVGTIWHVDLYRLSGQDETAELGLEDAAGDGVMLVEWPDRAPGLFPGSGLEIVFTFCDTPDARLIALHGGPDWAERLRECPPAEEP